MDIGKSRAVVTGAASGLGREICLSLCREGASVAALDKDAAGLERLREDCPDGLTTYRVDVSKQDEVVDAVSRAFDDLGYVDVLVNSAGIYRDGLMVRPLDDDFVTMPLAQWRTVVDVDLTGTFLVTREVALRMVRGGVHGVIVNISSVSRSGNTGQGNYSAAKAGVVAFTRSIALELAGHGIRAAAIAPGFIDTPILAAMDPARLADHVGRVPLRRLGTPREIFAGVRFVVECDYFTGRCLEIDGGYSLDT